MPMHTIRKLEVIAVTLIVSGTLFGTPHMSGLECLLTARSCEPDALTKDERLRETAWRATGTETIGSAQSALCSAAPGVAPERLFRNSMAWLGGGKRLGAVTR